MTVRTEQTPGTGEMMRYEDLYASVTPEMVARAEEVEREILHQHANIQKGYMTLAGQLSAFKRERLYLARSFPTFESWANSDDLKGLGSRTAYNLVRIADEFLPILDKHDAWDKLPGISTMYDMLPMLNDENAEEKILQALDAVQGLPTRGAKDAIKEIRGIAAGPDEEQPAIFKAKFEDVGDYIRVHVWCSTNNDYYQVSERGPLMVKKRDWPRMQTMFRGFVEEA